MIYEMALKVDDGNTGYFQVRAYETWASLCGPRSIVPRTQRPGLLSVNRQIRIEALALFYAINTFAVTYSRATSDVEKVKAERAEVGSWLKTISPTQAAMIKSLKVRFWFHNRNIVESHASSWLVPLHLQNEDLKKKISGALQLEKLGIAGQVVEVEYDDYSRGKVWYIL